MYFLQGIGIILSLNFFLLLSGYPVVSKWKDLSCTDRLGLSILFGLAWLLFVLSWVGSLAPLKSVWILAAGIPAAFALASAACREKLRKDFGRVATSPLFYGLGLATFVFLTALLFPLLKNPGLVFFEGTGALDNFFWAMDAEYLTRYSYMAPFTQSVPLFLATAQRFSGWQPMWGRMGAEGYLAFVSIFTGKPVLYSYNYAAAALYLPWLAGVILLLRTFISRRLSILVLMAAFLLQPIFIFFHANGNIPNLTGAIMGVTVLLGIQWGLQRNPLSSPWPGWLVIALATHGIVCSYPEMLPFVGLPGFLLLVGYAVRAHPGMRAKRLAGVAGAGLAGGLLNPVSTVRAVYGFLDSFAAGRINQQWGSLLEELHPFHYPLFLVSLAAKACPMINSWLAAGISLLLGIGFVLAVRQSNRRLETLALFSGYAALLAYSLMTGFEYGFQKAVQFSGIIVAALFPAGCLIGFGLGRPAPVRWKIAGRLMAAVLVIFFTYATIQLLAYNYRSAQRKYLTEDMFALGQQTPPHDILVAAETFSRTSFWSMWASYLFPNSNLIFSRVTDSGAGYLRDDVTYEKSGETPQPEAFLVSEKWARTMDANSSRIRAGGGYVLLSESNRLLQWKGADLQEGAPTSIILPSVLVLRPHRDCRFHLALRSKSALPETTPLRVVLQIYGMEKKEMELAGSANGWETTLLLKGNVDNTITLNFSHSGSVSLSWELLDYSISDL